MTADEIAILRQQIVEVEKSVDDLQTSLNELNAKMNKLDGVAEVAEKVRKYWLLVVLAIVLGPRGVGFVSHLATDLPKETPVVESVMLP